MTNVHPLHNSTPEQRGKDALYKLLKGEADFDANNRDQWLVYGAALNELKAEHPGKAEFGKAKEAAGLDKWPEDRSSNLEERDIHPAILTAAMWAASLTPAELAGYEAAHPNTRITRDGGFRGLHAAAKPAKGIKASKPRATETLDAAVAVARQIVEETGKPVSGPQLQKKLGIARGTGDTAAAIVNTEVKVHAETKAKEPVIDVSTLPGNAKQKLDRVLDQELKRLQREYSAEVQKLKDAARKELEDERNRLIDELANTYKPLGNRVRELEAARKGIMTESEYKKILMCLHPDRREAVSPEELSEAFRIFKSKNIRLLPNEVTATTSTPLPDTWAELEKRRMRK